MLDDSADVVKALENIAEFLMVRAALQGTPTDPGDAVPDAVLVDEGLTSSQSLLAFLRSRYPRLPFLLTDHVWSQQRHVHRL
mgnify:CR=1 FL=1